MRRACLVVAALAVAVCGSLTAQTRYNRATDWGERPAGLAWAAVIGAEPGPDGNIYVLHRCYDNSCAGRGEAPFMVFDPSGKLLRSWGQGQFVFPHGFYVHRDGHVWATDGQGATAKVIRCSSSAPTAGYFARSARPASPARGRTSSITD